MKIYTYYHINNFYTLKYCNVTVFNNELITIEYGTGMVDASSREIRLGIGQDKIGSAVISVTVGTNGATPITMDPLDVNPEYSIGPSSYSTLLFFVSILVS